MKARTSTKRRGRPPKDAERTESGRISRSISQFERDAISWKRRRDFPDAPAEDLRLQEYGSVIHRWHQKSLKAAKRAEEAGKPPEFVFTYTHQWTAEKLLELHGDYNVAIGAKTPLSASDFRGPGGYDGRDPFATKQADPDRWTITRWRETRKAILESGPLGMMAVEAILFENKDCPELLADFRLALNSVERLWRMARAA